MTRTQKEPPVPYIVETHRGVRVVVVRDAIPLAQMQRFAASAARELKTPRADVVLSPIIAHELGANFALVSLAGWNQWQEAQP